MPMNKCNVFANKEIPTKFKLRAKKLKTKPINFQERVRKIIFQIHTQFILIVWSVTFLFIMFSSLCLQSERFITVVGDLEVSLSATSIQIHCMSQHRPVPFPEHTVQML